MATPGGGYELTIIVDELRLHLVSLAWIAIYYIWTHFAIRAVAANSQGALRKEGFIDVTSTLFIIGIPIFAIVNIVAYVSDPVNGKSITVLSLMAFYIYFIFFFAFLYCSCNWHRPGEISNLQNDDWNAEWQYFLVSAQTQTTLGYNVCRPTGVLAATLSICQVLTGLFFVAVAVARAVNLTSSS